MLIFCAHHGPYRKVEGAVIKLHKCFLYVNANHKRITLRPPLYIVCTSQTHITAPVVDIDTWQYRYITRDTENAVGGGGEFQKQQKCWWRRVVCVMPETITGCHNTTPPHPPPPPPNLTSFLWRCLGRGLLSYQKVFNKSYTPFPQRSNWRTGENILYQPSHCASFLRDGVVVAIRLSATSEPHHHCSIFFHICFTEFPYPSWFTGPCMIYFLEN